MLISICWSVQGLEVLDQATCNLVSLITAGMKPSVTPDQEVSQVRIRLLVVL